MGNRTTIFLMVSLALVSCSKDEPISNATILNDGKGPTPMYIPIPDRFSEYNIPESNLPTEEGVTLGRKLFYETLLSRENNVSCGSCHQQAFAFTYPDRLSIGTHGESSSLHSMALFNLAWQPRFFWNGRAPSLEIQAFAPVVNPLEMDMTWPEVEERLMNDEEYPKMFEAAFGTRVIDSVLVSRAIAQFEYTIISSESKFDEVQLGRATLSPKEQLGYEIFVGLDRGDCIHCHNPGDAHVSSFDMRNNGLDSEDDMKPGYYEVTGAPLDFGRFKTPSLRNLAFTAPYMHDGRFETLEEVIDFYSEGVHFTQTVDPFMEFASNGGVALEKEEKEALIAFLMTLTDSSLVTNPAYSDPNK